MRPVALRRLAGIVSTASVVLCGAARADDKSERLACSSAYVAAQTSRADHRLLAARAELRACARRECAPLMKGEMVRDCAEWLTEVEASIPSVVLSAKDESGGDLIDVRVSVDGAAIATKLDGRAIDLDPGSHTFLFELAPPPGAAGAAAATPVSARSIVTVTALVLEGSKNQVVRATLSPTPGGSAAPAPSSPSPEAARPPASAASAPGATSAGAPPPPSFSPGSAPPPPPGPAPTGGAARGPTHPNVPLVTAGLVSLGLGYAAAVIGGIVALASQSASGSFAAGCFGSAGLAFIPLVGPFLMLPGYPDHQVVSYGPVPSGGGAPVIQVADCDGGRQVFSQVVVADEVLQLGGLALLTSGLLLRSPVEPGGTPRSASIVLVPGAGGAPLGFTLRVVGF